MPRKFSRRTFVKAGLIGVPAAVLAGGAGAAWVWTSADTNTIGKIDFKQRLKIPPLANSSIDSDGKRVFELTAQAGTSELRPGEMTDTWGFNGSYLGPTLRAAPGEWVLINVANNLDEATTVHWHGMHLPARMDGGPHQMIDPGDTWSPTWQVDQLPATLWYHPHPHGKTREHVNRGLAGIFILDDAIGRELPHEYGVDDFPLIVQDRSIAGSGHMRDGDGGSTILINGTYGPYLDVTTELTRLRILNASAARVYNLGFSDDRQFSMIASDGGLLPTPFDTNRLELSPGERAEIVVPMKPAETVVLRSDQPDLGVNVISEQFDGGNDRFDLLQLRAADQLAPSNALPATLATAPHLIEQGANPTPAHRFEMQGHEINGREMDMMRIDLAVTVDTTEIWEVANTDSDYHNFHVHDVQFQVVDVNGAAPSAELGGWKDTIFMPPDRTTRLALHFSDYTDPNWPYMYHCHRLRHEDRGMMGQFVVVKPGQQPGMPPDMEHDHA